MGYESRRKGVGYMDLLGRGSGGEGDKDVG